MMSDISKKIKSFQRGDKGGVLVFVSLCLLPMLLMLGLAVDSSFGLAEKRKLQMACDAAAKAGATNGNGMSATITSEAQKVFTANTAGMMGITGPTVSVNSSSGAVTVSASIVVSNMFMTLGGIPTSTYSATATASPNTSGIGCVYSLNPTASGAINLSGGSQMNITGCGVYANSSSASAIQLSGSANIIAKFLKVVGNYTTSGGATVTTTQGITTGTAPISNPIGTITIPSYSSCNHNNFASATYGTQTINPGVYCNGITVSGSAAVTMNPGQYIIDGGSLTVGGSGTLSGSNVTIILTKKLTSSYPTVNVSGAASLNLSASTGNTSNPFNGIAIYQDPNAPSGVTNAISGSGNLNITGIISFPNQILNFSGGSFDNAPCTILIANELIFSGSGSINCPSSVISTYMAGR